MKNRKNLLISIMWIFIGLGFIKLSDSVPPLSMAHHGALLASIVCILIGARKLRSFKSNAGKLSE